MDQLIRDWTFAPSSPSMLSRLSRLKSRLTGPVPRPAFQVVKPFYPARRWNVLFLYLPGGRPSAGQLFTLARMAQMEGKLAVIAALPTDAPVPNDLDAADALLRKEMPGYDFSAYTLAAEQIAMHSPGARVYVQNDSVFGPFGDIDRLVEEAPWDFTGFLASSLLENHAQSFAFVVDRLDEAWLGALRPVLFERIAFDRYRDVVNLQETRLARIAARHGSVGAHWFDPYSKTSETPFHEVVARKLGMRPTGPVQTSDASLIHALVLLEKGFPFLKVSLLDRNAHLSDRDRLLAALRERGHPTDGL